MGKIRGWKEREIDFGVCVGGVYFFLLCVAGAIFGCSLYFSMLREVGYRKWDGTYCKMTYVSKNTLVVCEQKRRVKMVDCGGVILGGKNFSICPYRGQEKR